MKNQLNYSEDVLFNNYMVSSFGEEFVHSQIPYYINKNIYNNMIFYSENINRICIDILNNCTEKHKRILEYFEDFPYKEEIFNLKCPISPLYWTRYDTFINTSNEVKFAEFNYDKPCGQKEIHLAEKFKMAGNVNENFIEDILDEFEKICNNYSKENKNIGFLMDPCHYEELHHSYYFKHMMKSKNINIIPVGPKNLSVKNNEVYAYSSIRLNVIFRLFPTEFFYEISNIKEILECFEMGNVTIINDPRVLAIQAKGVFAYLWDLIKEDSKLISENDKKIIRQCIPYTEILNKDNVKNIYNFKDKYVIKASLGRYSEEVYIGKSFKDADWKDIIEEVLKSDKIHIIQEFIDIKPEYTYAPDIDNQNIPMIAYGNFGMYIMKEKVEGTLVRWSTDFLTDDNYTWMSPIGVDEFPIKVYKNNISGKDDYEDLSEYLAFKYGFTGEYTKYENAISLDYIVITNNLYKEIISVSKKFCDLLKKIYPHIQKNIDIFGPILGIPEELYKIIIQDKIEDICALGRIDFVVDNNSNLKLLEFNSETPAGIIESLGANEFIQKKYLIDGYNPNEKLRENIKQALGSIIKRLSKDRKIKNIAVVTSWHYEDIYNTNIIVQVLKEYKDYNIIFGNVYDLKTDNEELFLYGKKIDAIYRYYPLDWFYYEEEMRSLIEPLSKRNYMINPGHTLITQSKVFFALIYELMGKGILSNEDEEFVDKYIPYTTLERDKTLSCDYIIKPYLGREGENSVMNYEDDDYEYEKEDFIFQDRQNIRPLYIDLYDIFNKKKEYQFPVIGAYITQNEFAGLYTRMGNIITNKDAIYISTYIK